MARDRRTLENAPTKDFHPDQVLIVSNDNGLNVKVVVTGSIRNYSVGVTEDGTSVRGKITCVGNTHNYKRKTPGGEVVFRKVKVQDPAQITG